MEDLLKDQEVQGTWILNFFDNTKKRVAKDKLTVSYLESRLALLEDYWTRYLETHKKLLRISDPQVKAYVDSEQFEKVEAEYVDTRASFNTSIVKMRGVPKPETTGQDDQGLLPPTMYSRSSLDALPKLNIPKFSGNQLEWASFRDMFCSMVHDVPNLSKVMKLQHLKQALTGDAAKRLKNIPVTAAHYDDAWKSLVKRYDNKRVMLSAHMRNLLSCAPAASKSVEEILRLLDTATEAIRAFTSLERPVDQWDDWLVHLIAYKLDQSTREDWEQSLSDTADFPTYNDLSDFLERRVRALETARFTGLGTPGAASSPSPQPKNKKQNQQSQTSVNVATPSEPSKQKAACSSCQGTHFLSYCQKFKKISVPQRRQLVTQNSLCYNCLRQHPVADCPSEKRCFVCTAKHHTLLHEEVSKETTAALKKSEAPSVQPKAKGSSVTELPSTSAFSARVQQPSNVVLLATAIVTLESSDGTTLKVRALLDEGSQASFVTERVAQMMRLPKTRISLPVTGIGAMSAGVVKYRTRLLLRTPIESGWQLPFQPYIMHKLTSVLPPIRVPKQKWTHLDGLPLADPNFGEPREVDCLLGAEMYGVLLRDGRRPGNAYEPSGQNTVFGWILSGSAATTSAHTPPESGVVIGFCGAYEPMVSEQLRAFWELEEVRKPIPYTADEKRCEEFFVATHARDESGRYIVRLLRASDITPTFTNSRAAAVGFQRRYERSQKVDPMIRDAYAKFMAEYENLGHMEQVQESEGILNAHAFYTWPAATA